MPTWILVSDIEKETGMKFSRRTIQQYSWQRKIETTNCGGYFVSKESLEALRNGKLRKSKTNILKDHKKAA